MVKLKSELSLRSRTMKIRPRPSSPWRAPGRWRRQWGLRWSVPASTPTGSSTHSWRRRAQRNGRGSCWRQWIWSGRRWEFEVSSRQIVAQLTAAKCPAVIERPTDSGTALLLSVRRGSLTPCTTKTRINVIKASIITPWATVIKGFTAVTPKLPTSSVGVAT